MTSPVREFEKSSGTIRTRRAAESAGADEGSFSPDVCVSELFERQAARTPDAVAVIADDAQLSYAALEALAEAWAHRLRGLGVRPGVLVGVCLEHSPTLIAALLSVWKAGGAFLALDPQYPTDSLVRMLTDAAPAVLLTARVQADRLPELDAVVVALDAPEANGWPAPSPAPAASAAAAGRSRPRPGEPAYVIYPSGSTSRPKSVTIEHRGLANHLGGIAATVFRPGPVNSLLPRSLSFDFSFTGLFLPLATGGTLRLAAPGSPPEQLARLIQDPGLHLVRLTPPQIQALASALDGKAGLAGPGVLLIGGAAGGGHELLHRAGDVATLDEDGHLEPSEVQAHLEQLPYVRAAAVVMARNERLTAFVVTGSGAAPETSAVPEALAARLPEVAVLRAGPNQDAEDSSLLEAVCRIWAEVLEIPAVAPHDNFFDLGGNSIGAMKVAAQCRQLGLAITSRKILLADTVAQLLDETQHATTG
ncbi:AMP-binding protein [Catenulispora sp. NL8]|uniref:AMP-binding protein n=1 Tax=Catenulispora pinistramenti TaxID=2705254 RepID=A0ABS5KQ60_9ACTN|nr:AMP-binding protein [Catenulispora pinistramenti]MBS2548187.1 AMP-binding protein [Catenulispora pinistramenti]